VFFVEGQGSKKEEKRISSERISSDMIRQEEPHHSMRPLDFTVFLKTQFKCRCGTITIKHGWGRVCPNRRWWNFFLHHKD
jgi:hypothetical protein